MIIVALYGITSMTTSPKNFMYDPSLVRRYLFELYLGNQCIIQEPSLEISLNRLLKQTTSGTLVIGTLLTLGQKFGIRHQTK